MSLCRADKLLLAGGAAVAGAAVAFGPSAVSLGVPAAAFAGLLVDGIFRPASGVLYPTVTHGPRDRPEVALTFDDGPDPVATSHVLDTLAAHRARATFFVIGRNLERARPIGERIVAEGHELANHSWEHAYTQNFYGRRRQTADIERAAALIRSITGGSDMPLYRPPVGLKSPELARAAHRMQLKVIAWSLHSRDTFARDAQRIANRVLARVQPGDIVLLHDGHQTPDKHRSIARDALPTVLEGLHRKRLAPVTVSELLRP